MPVNSRPGVVFSFRQLSRSATFKGLPGLLADALPDKYGNALIDAWLAQQGRPSGSMNPVETLCFIGKRSMGALEFVPATAPVTDTAVKVEIDSLVSMADRILNNREAFSATLSTAEEKELLDILKIGTSAGGARAKALIAYNTQTGEVKSGQAAAPEGFSHWLIKFDGITDSQFGVSLGYGKVEMAYHAMAVDCGIEMAECRLLEENGRAHFMTRRFDRPDNKTKLHMQTFCGLQHYDFNEVGLYSYEQLFETMRKLQLPYPQQEQMFRRMVFNVLARNCDDHTKNFSFLMNNRGHWYLAPAYDVCYAYRPGSHWVSSQSLSVNAKRSDITRADMLAVAKLASVKKGSAIIDHIGSIVQNWPKYARRYDVETKLTKAINATLLQV
jgi:serine/threonine-protein kinase HipA